MPKLYEGSFNFHGEVHKFFRRAHTINQAFFYMTRKLSQKLKVTHLSIKYYFGGMKNNYKITEIED